VRDLWQAYKLGRGTITMRGKAEVEKTLKGDREQGRDNISVVMAHVGPPPPCASCMRRRR
jgi:hypothetical protein